MRHRLSKVALSLIVAVTVALPLVPAQRAAAATGNCFFKGNGGPVLAGGKCSVAGRYGAYGTNDVLTGRDGNGNGWAIPTCAGSIKVPNCVNNKNDSDTKPQFIKFIKNRFNKGAAQDRVGAAFIIQELRSNTDHSWPSAADVADWENLMNQNNVSVTRGYDGSVGRTSYYDPAKRNTFYAAHPKVGRDVIYVRQNGKLLAEIEAPCGNMVAGPIPIITQWELKGTSAVNTATAGRGDTVAFTHTVKNKGPDDMGDGLSAWVWWHSSTGPGVTNLGLVTACSDNDGLDADDKKTCNNGPIWFTIPVTANGGDRYCQQLVYGPISNGGGYDSTADACVTVTPPQPLVCNSNSFTFTPGTELSVSQALNIRFAATGPAPGPPAGVISLHLNITGPGGYSFDQTHAAGTGPPSYASDFNVPSLTSMGLYTVTAQATDTSGIRLPSDSCHAVFTVVTRPYFSVTGGDIAASGTIRSWNQDGSGGSYNGAGSVMAAIAGSYQGIRNFVTGRELAWAYHGTGLAFANATGSGANPSAGIYGGKYAFSPSSAPSYTCTGTTVNLASSGTYCPSGNINLSGTVGSGQHITIVATSGNVTINGNILYGPYNSLATIPSLTVIVPNGNILVSKTVNEIHGTFYAPGHTFISCADGGSQVLNIAIYDQCQIKLTVYGAVSAKEFILNRTKGDFNTPYVPAEEFVYSPELWLAPTSSTSGSSTSPYDYYISLPPVL